MTPRLFKNTLTFTRKNADGYWDDSGSWVEGTPALPYTVKGSLQPFKKGKERTDLPEGIKARDAKLFYTMTEVLTVDDYGGVEPDVTTINGIDYVAYDIEDWYTPAINNTHYKVTLIRRDKLNGN